MSNILAPHKKKWLSNAILLSFLLLVGATAYLSNAFKTPLKSHNEFIEQALVFNNKELDTITALALKNKSGEYTFVRNETAPGSPWHMTSPRDMSVNSVFIEKLFSSLGTIKTKKLLSDDNANRSNFSLEKPTAILTLSDEAGKSLILSMGIMNTIDNSTYMKMSGRTGIYHVEAPSISLENLAINDLVESTVFSIDIKTILGFKIFKKNSSTAQFEIKKKDGIWTNVEGKKLNHVKIEDMVDDFVNIKSSFILDQPADLQKKPIKDLTNSSDYVVKVEQSNNEILSYQVSSIATGLSSITGNDEPYFVITENHAPIVYVIKKDVHALFDLKNENLKSLEEAN